MKNASIVNRQRLRTAVLCTLLSIESSQLVGAQIWTDSLHACDLASPAEVDKITGSHSKREAGRTGTTIHNQSACDFWDAKTQVALYSGRMPQKVIDRILTGNGFAVTKHSVGGVGDSAAIYFTPPNKVPEAWLFAFVGGRVVTVRVAKERGQSAESAQPAAVGLAKIAVRRVK